MLFIILYKFNILYIIILYIYICFFYVYYFHKICKHFSNPLYFPCCRLFPRSSASDAKPGHCHCCGCPMMTTPNHHHHPESLTPSDLTGSMSMMPTTTRSCQLWFAPSSVPRAELRMELVELPKSCSCTYGYHFWNDVASPFWTTSQRDLRLGTAPAIRSWCSAPWWLIRPPWLSCKI